MERKDTVGPYLLLEDIRRDKLATTWRAAEVADRKVTSLCELRIFDGEATDRTEVASAIARLAPLEKRLSAPGFGRLRGIGQDNAAPYIAYAYVPAVSFREVIEGLEAEKRGAGAHVALLMTERIALALGAAWNTAEETERLPHGFLTSHQVFISHEGEVYTTGFSAAPGARRSLVDHPGRARRVPGAAVDTGFFLTDFDRYLSPAALAGEPIRPGDDVYSLGVLLFELLAGRPLIEPSRQSPAEAIAELDLGSETSEVAESIRMLLSVSLEDAQSFASVSIWRNEVSRILDASGHQPTAFNIAFLLRALFTEKMEAESRALTRDAALVGTFVAPTEDPAAETSASEIEVAPEIDTWAPPEPAPTSVVGPSVVGPTVVGPVTEPDADAWSDAAPPTEVWTAMEPADPSPSPLAASDFVHVAPEPEPAPAGHRLEPQPTASAASPADGPRAGSASGPTGHELDRYFEPRPVAAAPPTVETVADNSPVIQAEEPATEPPSVERPSMQPATAAAPLSSTVETYSQVVDLGLLAAELGRAADPVVAPPAAREPASNPTSFVFPGSAEGTGPAGADGPTSPEAPSELTPQTPIDDPGPEPHAGDREPDDRELRGEKPAAVSPIVADPPAPTTGRGPRYAALAIAVLAIAVAAVYLVMNRGAAPGEHTSPTIADQAPEPTSVAAIESIPATQAPDPGPADAVSAEPPSPVEAPPVDPTAELARLIDARTKELEEQLRGEYEREIARLRIEIAEVAKPSPPPAEPAPEPRAVAVAEAGAEDEAETATDYSRSELLDYPTSVSQSHTPK